MTRSAARQRGATLVEFAITAPVLFLVMIAMLDIGLVVIGNTIGSNAAREGARVGIIGFVDADDDGWSDATNGFTADGSETASAAYQAIFDAVEAKLGNMLSGTPDVHVRCLDASESLDQIDCDEDLIEFDRDLLEVSVRWSHLGVSPFVSNSQHVERIRMVINGEPDLTAIPPPPATVSVAVSPNPVDEDAGTVTVTISRSHNVSSFDVTWSAASGLTDLAIAGLDYTAAGDTFEFTAGGPLAVTRTVSILDDVLYEPIDETFTVTISPSGDADAPDPTETVTIVSDDLPPPASVQGVTVLDSDTDGRIDQLLADFDNPVTCAGSWTISGVTGASTGGAFLADSTTVRVPVNEGNIKTDITGVSVSWSGVCNASDGSVSSGSGLVDGSSPVLTGVSTGSNGRLEAGDQITFTFSEAIVNGVPGSTLVSLDNNNPDRLTINGVLSAATPLQSDGYLNTNGNKTAEFNNSTVSGSGGAVLTVTVGPTCSAQQAQTCTALAASSATASGAFTPASTLLDSAGNGATGTFSFSTGYAPF